MDKQWMCLLLPVIMLSTGCTGIVAQNKEEYKTSTGVSLESYVVNRPYSKVAATMKSKTKECLDIKLRRRSCVGNNCSDDYVTYTPTLNQTANNLELSVQIDVPHALRWWKEPPGGKYILTAVITPTEVNKTKLDVYRPWAGYDLIPSAVRNWAEGTNLGCPNLAKEAR